ncbi:hypothetical protein AYI70_g710 [Smittium culicis]|uniref:SH3 domain-containing protein n=1 Tax=Smittium culicis TaxID=133412 RepID=A0A1R1YFN1_9FUNG|nr:hypothetical protein AYI70_g710 [Smittium culicis]
MPPQNSLLVQYPYIPEQKDEPKIMPEEILETISKDIQYKNGWHIGRNQEGPVGKFPANNTVPLNTKESSAKNILGDREINETVGKIDKTDSGNVRSIYKTRQKNISEAGMKRALYLQGSKEKKQEKDVERSFSSTFTAEPSFSHSTFENSDFIERQRSDTSTTVNVMDTNSDRNMYIGKESKYSSKQKSRYFNNFSKLRKLVIQDPTRKSSTKSGINFHDVHKYSNMETNEAPELFSEGFNDNEMLMSDDGSCFSYENGIYDSDGGKEVNLSIDYKKIGINETQNNSNENSFNLVDLVKGNNGDYIRVPERSKTIGENRNDKSYNKRSSYIDRNLSQAHFPALGSVIINNQIVYKNEEQRSMLPMKIKDKVHGEILIKDEVHSSNHTSLKPVNSRNEVQKNFSTENGRMRSGSSTLGYRNNISDMNFENTNININGHHGRAVKHNVSFFSSPPPPASRAQFYSTDRNINLPSMRRGLNISKVSYTEGNKERSGEVIAGEISIDDHNNIKLSSSGKVFRQSELRSFIKQDNLTNEITRVAPVINTGNDAKKENVEYRKHYIPTKKPTISLSKRNRKISFGSKNDDVNKTDQDISSKASDVAPAKKSTDESNELENNDSSQPDIFSSQLLIKYGMIRSSKLDMEKHDDDEDGNYQSNSISSIHTSKNMNALRENDRKLDAIKETQTTNSIEKPEINLRKISDTIVNEKVNVGAKQYGTSRNKLNSSQANLSKSDGNGTDKNDAKEENAKMLVVGTSDKASRLRTPSGRSFIIKPKMMKLKSSVNSVKRPESKHYGNKIKQEKGLIKKQTVIIRRNAKKSPRLIAIEQHVKRASILENILAIKGKKIGANGKRTKASEFVNLKSGIENNNKSSKKTVPYPGSAENSVETVSKKANCASMGAFSSSAEKRQGISKQGNASRDNFRKNVEKLGLVKKQNKKADVGAGGLKATGSEDELAEKNYGKSPDDTNSKMQKSIISPLRIYDTMENEKLGNKISAGMLNTLSSIRFINKDNLKSPILTSNYLARVEEPLEKNLELINEKILGNKIASGFRRVNLKPKTPNNSISEIDGIKSYLEHDKNADKYFEKSGRMGSDAINGGEYVGIRTIDSKNHSMDGSLVYEKHHNVDNDFDARDVKIVACDGEASKTNVAKLDSNNYKLLAISDGIIMNKKKPISKFGKHIDKSMISPPLKVDKSPNGDNARHVKEGEGNDDADAGAGMGILGSNGHKFEVGTNSEFAKKGGGVVKHENIVYKMISFMNAGRKKAVVTKPQIKKLINVKIDEYDQYEGEKYYSHKAARAKVNSRTMSKSVDAKYHAKRKNKYESRDKIVFQNESIFRVNNQLESISNIPKSAVLSATDHLNARSESSSTTLKASHNKSINGESEYTFNRSNRYEVDIPSPAVRKMGRGKGYEELVLNTPMTVKGDYEYANRDEGNVIGGTLKEMAKGTQAFELLKLDSSIGEEKGSYLKSMKIPYMHPETDDAIDYMMLLNYSKSGRIQVGGRKKQDDRSKYSYSKTIALGEYDGSKGEIFDEGSSGLFMSSYEASIFRSGDRSSKQRCSKNTNTKRISRIKAGQRLLVKKIKRRGLVKSAISSKIRLSPGSRKSTEESSWKGSPAYGENSSDEHESSLSFGDKKHLRRILAKNANKGKNSGHLSGHLGNEGALDDTKYSGSYLGSNFGSRGDDTEGRMDEEEEDTFEAGKKIQASNWEESDSEFYSVRVREERDEEVACANAEGNDQA